jgi:RNA polymerase sigma factor (sigma-70 family)
MGKEILNRDDFIDRFRAGDPDALIALWEYCVKHLIRIIRRLQRQLPEIDPENVLMQVFLDWYERKCPSYDKSKGPFKRWARVVVMRAGLYELRERLPFPHVSLEEYEEIPSPETLDCENISGEPESEVPLKWAVEQLSEKCRVVVWQKFYEGQPTDVIAKNLGITESAVRMRLSRGLQKLREILKGTNPRELQGRRKRIGQGDPR